MTGDSHGFSVSYRFPVLFTEDAWNPENPVLASAISRLEPERRHRLLVVVDDAVARKEPALLDAIPRYAERHAATLELLASPLLVAGGEAVKNDLAHTRNVLEAIHRTGLDRQSFVLVIGGGATLDMVSFAAALAHRSVRVVRMPTTVLSQADSGVAVKNGINLFGKKNFIGTFMPPFAVVSDFRFLDLLEHRDRVAGVAEAIKVALLRDRGFYEAIESAAGPIARGERAALQAMIRRSAELHLAHICGNGDPFELRSGRPLDFGHWAAHKLESMTGNRLRHGEAVAIGIALDLRYSVRRGYLDAGEAERVLALFEAVGLPLWDDALGERDESGRSRVLRGLLEFQEHLGGGLHVTLLRGIGESFEVTEMDEATVEESIADLARRRSARAPLQACS